MAKTERCRNGTRLLITDMVSQACLTGLSVRDRILEVTDWRTCMSHKLLTDVEEASHELLDMMLHKQGQVR